MRRVEEAQQADYVGFLHRHPFSTDAFELGYAVGVREDYSYQAGEFPNVDLPVNILDNDFRDPDLDRYLEAFHEYDPSVVVLGDVYDIEDAQKVNQVVGELQEEYPYKEYVVVPKFRNALRVLDDDVTLGYAMGYSDVQASDFSTPRDWRGRRVHLLGASPGKQYDVIQELTQPTLFDDPPADIAGLDWNGMHKGASFGEYWGRDGWQSAESLSIRETVRRSLEEVKEFWQAKGVWPETEPIDLYGPAVREPDELIYMDQGGDPITTRDALEKSFVDSYQIQGEKREMAFQDETQKEFIEYREGWV